MSEQQYVPIESTGQAAYTAAREQVALADLSACGWVRITGPDRASFLQRLTTNDCRTLAPGRGLPTVLTSATGRIIGFVIAYASDEALYLRAERGQGPNVARYLANLIFWNDHVVVADLTAETTQWGLYGPAATSHLAGLLGNDSLLGLAPYASVLAEISGVPVTLCRGGSLELPAWTIVVPAASAPAALAALEPAGPWLDPATLVRLRVEAGLPTWGHELGDQVTPLEAGLREAVSFNKGCYTGQEVIARQENYDKVTRVLVGLLLPDDLTDENLVELAGAAVHAGPARPGYVGTAAWSPAVGRPVALAVVPRDAAEPGSSVTIRAGGREIPATVTELPFAGPAQAAT